MASKPNERYGLVDSTPKYLNFFRESLILPSGKGLPNEGNRRSRMQLEPLNRHNYTGANGVLAIGRGEPGGKAHALADMHEMLIQRFDQVRFPRAKVVVPHMVVLTTDVFERFVERNRLRRLLEEDTSLEQVARAFLTASMPTEILGDLHTYIARQRTPIAVRSSGLLEDALENPFAGVYATKMIPNHQGSTDARFNALVNAVKLVFASTWFPEARAYRQAAGRGDDEEKMAVILQEVVGRRRHNRFYPLFSGVGRSINFYPTGRSKPEQGVVNLALGLGKQIVDGGIAWTYCPAQPKAPPPVAGPRDLLDLSQRTFWAVNMGEQPIYNPIGEDEYLIQAGLKVAEADGILRHVASTYDGRSDRMVLGTGVDGPRAVTFAPLLQLPDYPVNDIIRALLHQAEETFSSPVEIEFAGDIYKNADKPLRVGFLQARPMRVSSEEVNITADELESNRRLASSRSVLGNGIVEGIQDIVYVDPESFNLKHSRSIAMQIDAMNRTLRKEGRPYLLIGFGRWGSTDPWLGIPVQWSQIAEAKVILELTRPDLFVDPSQGSHFFHNVTGFQVLYFHVRHDRDPAPDWEWLGLQEQVKQTEHVRHVRIREPLRILADGRTGTGVILHG
ncbi:hypothetical protein GF324_08135 [bacterium]|nr:hypothetical protein [bacterium]